MKSTLPLHRGTALVVATLLVLRTSPALADPKPPPSVQADARARFDQGIKLFNEGDNAGALAEFERAYNLIPNPLVLYNIGLVYAAMGRSVDAVATLDQVIANPGPVTGDKLRRANETRDQQAKRIVELSITTNVPASIDIDGVGVGHTPFAGTIKVTGGVHQVGAVASGYVPTRKELTVAGGTKEEVNLSLEALQTLMAHASVRTHLPGAEVFVDGHAAGTTPLPESLTLKPGRHTIEMRREGYRTARQDLDVGEGADAEVVLDPQEDAAAIAIAGGALALDVSEPNANVTVDGTSRGVYGAALRLAPGHHQVIVDRGGFEPVTMDAFITPHRTSTLQVFLEPTAETRAAYDHKRSVRHETGLLIAGGGALIAGGSIAYIVWNAGQVNNALGPYNAARAAQVNGTGSLCDVALGGDPNSCNSLVQNDYNNVRSAENLTPIGYIGLGVGVGVIAAGLAVFFTAGSADRFRHRAPAAGALQLLPWAARGGGGFGATLKF